MKFTDRLQDKLLPIWRKNHAHPFVTGIGDGTLDHAKFRFYMVQDYLYLIDYAKVFALGAMKAGNDVRLMGKFAELLHGTINFEMDLHRTYAERFGISAEELENAQPSPVVLAYTHYMLAASQNGSLADLVAAILPCAWSYWEIGKELAQIPGACEHPFFGDWINTYNSEEFATLAQWCIELMDEVAEGKTEAELQRLEDIFLNTTRFEYLFWDMAQNQQMWPEGLA